MPIRVSNAMRLVRRDRRRGGCRMAAVNRVMLLGRVMAAPRPGTGTIGDCVLFSVSTEGAGQNDAGQRHRVRVTGDQAAWCLARLRRGMLVHVEGELLACAQEGEASAVVAAWLVQAVEDDRRSGPPVHARLHAPVNPAAFSGAMHTARAETLHSKARCARAELFGRGTDEQAGDEAGAWPLAWRRAPEMAGGVPGMPSGRMH
ncbi:single-stranded DNA-binding protein [Desulfovibrio oxamicus]|uniref:Single-stranded DNA-binding protein n=1 Tax=Nitratidesulfovibrio oxamicus TaxID=32016 RepID=A0ABS0J2M8_9BACT|nr:single-stranded DNA-binding protein [Nitratidesulfovibrio oxamicus]MBG3876693.1 single-stranded DNA-binding protein [Nitratidesulfovibrio oxamicus]